MNVINITSNQLWRSNNRELQVTILNVILWKKGDILDKSDILDSLADTIIKIDNVLCIDITQGIDINNLNGDIIEHYVAQTMDLCHGYKMKVTALSFIKNYQTLKNQIKKDYIN